MNVAPAIAAALPAPVPAPTTHARETYLPDAQRYDIALCLSGGGFRAALFHLGAVRRLYELGILDEVRTIVAVSGGSMTAAFLAARCDVWRHRHLTPGEWDKAIAEPFRRFTSRNLNVLPILIGWLPWNWGTNAGLEAFADACEERGLTRQTTDTLPAAPRFLFATSDLVSGAQYLFRPGQVPARRIALAVAASSAFPGFFRPFTEKEPEHIALLDGGLNDDRGLEPVWRTHAHLLSSDGGDVLQPEWGESVVWTLARSARVVFNQSIAIQKRWLLSNLLAGQLKGSYWGIESSPMHFVGTPGASRFDGYTPELARDVIAVIRTDYDAFSDAEAAVLENHGYFLADAAARRHLTDLIQRQVPLSVPHPAWLTESKVRAALHGSGRKRPFRRR